MSRVLCSLGFWILIAVGIVRLVNLQSPPSRVLVRLEFEHQDRCAPREHILGVTGRNCR